MILAGDIGGTSTRLAYFEVKDGRLLPNLVMKYPSQQYAGLENIAVISAGTGLGEGYAVWDADGRRFQVFASEGGHADFAPQDELEVELLLFLRRKFNGHVSCERVVSGPGLRNIYDFLRATGRGEEEEWLHDAMKRGDPSAVIAKAGMDGISACSNRCPSASS